MIVFEVPIANGLSIPIEQCESNEEFHKKVYWPLLDSIKEYLMEKEKEATAA